MATLKTVPVRRIVTHDDENGLSYAMMDGIADNVIGGLTELWLTQAGPHNHKEAVDNGAASKRLDPPKGGTVFRAFEIPPASQTAHLSLEEKKAAWADLFRTMGSPGAQPDTRRDPGMHKTPSTDYIILLSGEITLILDKTEHTLKPFDVVVQRGTNHAWVNRGTETAFLMAILVDANQH